MPVSGEPAGTRDVNPLLVAVFCPTCVLSGIVALGAGGLFTLPGILGVPAEHYLAAVLVFGSLAAWLAWGRWSRAEEDACGCSTAETVGER